MTGSEKKLQTLINRAARIVFFGGAGVSTGSRIPYIRSENGIVRNAFHGLTMEMILSVSCFHLHPDLFYEYYRKNLLFPDAVPNAAHLKLAEMEAAHRLSALITQNVDGLHKKAGSRAVYPLHGSIYENICMDCGHVYGIEPVVHSTGVPKCSICGGTIRPGITLYGEAPDPLVMRGACREISRADLLIVGGTSLTVEPAASCISYFRSSSLVTINESALELDTRATLAIHGPIEEVLGEICIEPRSVQEHRNWWS